MFNRLSKIHIDIGFWALLATNGYLVYSYLQNPDYFSDIVVIYWIQSVLIGFFTVLDMLVLKNVIVTNSDNSKDNFSNKGVGCLVPFFIVHFGGFHFGYLIFLTTMVVDFKHMHWSFIKMAFWFLVASSALNFIQHIRLNKTKPVSMAAIFILPYARIVPMHLMILLPQFLHIPQSMIFLVLKTIADLVMYVVYRKFVFKESNNSAVQNM